MVDPVKTPAPVREDVVADFVRDTRYRAALTVREFAQLLGVHPSTVSRWEMPGARSNVEPLQRALMLLIRTSDIRAIIPEMRSELATRGALAGLYVLLRCAYGPRQP